MSKILYIVIASIFWSNVDGQIKKISESTFKDAEQKLSKYSSIIEDNSSIDNSIYESDIHKKLNEKEVLFFANDLLIYSVESSCNNASCDLLIRKYTRKGSRISLKNQIQLQGRHSLNFFPDTGNMVSFEEDKITFFGSDLASVNVYKPFSSSIKYSLKQFEEGRLFVLTSPEDQKETVKFLVFADEGALILEKEMNELNKVHVSRLLVNGNSLYFDLYDEKNPNRFQIAAYSNEGLAKWKINSQRPVRQWISLDSRRLLIADRDNISYFNSYNGNSIIEKSIASYGNSLGAAGKLAVSSLIDLGKNKHAIIFNDRQTGNSTLSIIDSITNDVRFSVDLGKSKSTFKLGTKDGTLKVFNSEKEMSYEIE